MKTATRRDQSQTQHGYSLAEVLVAIAIFALIILAALAAFDRSNKMFKVGVESSNMQQNTRVAFDKLVGDLRMAGFDFDRDGIPAGSVGGTNTYQQPDEQFEYIGPSAIVIRANFDYESESAPCATTTSPNCDNGREGAGTGTAAPAYESARFPVVTTANDEIVAYALVPDSQTTIPSTCDPATNCIEFFADTYTPRASYPDTGGQDERRVQIKGVDLCNGGCNNPPYTLYRFTLDRSQSDFSTGNNIIRTPLASGIRNLSFTYYQDSQGMVPLKDLLDTTDISTGATIRGLGQFRVSAPGALVAERSIRTKVNSIRVALTGMNEAPDLSYTDTAETVTAVRRYRKYQLNTLVSPRNIQKRGMKEQDITAPGAPTAVQVCTGRCGGVFVSWTAPNVNVAQGAPDQYTVIYGPTSTFGFPCETPAFTQTFGWVFGGDSPSCPPLDPTLEYKFAVVALNSYGSGTSGTYQGFRPINATRPNRPTSVTAVADGPGRIKLTWRRPTTDESGGMTCNTGSRSTDIPPAEIYGYRVERTTDPSNPALWTVVGPESSVQSYQDLVEWTDTSVVSCVNYTYRVKTYERCATNAAYNSGSNIALGSSDWSDTVAAATTSTARPSPPADLQINQSSVCGGGTCNVQMAWRKVSTDVGTNPINVAVYRVWRKPYGAPDTSYARVFQSNYSPIPTGPDITWTDMNVPVIDGSGNPLRYEYKVTAVHCTTLESDPSPVRSFPCAFGAGIVGTPTLISNAFDGDGSVSNPWLANTEITVDVNAIAPASIASTRWTLTNLGTGTSSNETDSAPPFSINWATANGARYRIDAVITDTNGCIRLDTKYVEDEAQNCCLVPKNVDPTVVSHVTGNAFVDVLLKNVCGAALNLQRFTFTWTDAVTQNGTKVDSVSFIPPSGTTTTYTVPGADAGAFNQSIVPPVGTVAVPAGSTTYKVRITFTKTLVNPSSPITAVSVEYRRATDTTNQPCPIQ